MRTSLCELPTELREAWGTKLKRRMVVQLAVMWLGAIGLFALMIAMATSVIDLWSVAPLIATYQLLWPWSFAACCGVKNSVTVHNRFCGDDSS